MVFSQNLNQTLNLSLSQYGLNDEDISSELAMFKDIRERVKSSKLNGSMPFLNLPEQTSDLNLIRTIADDFRSRFDRLVVFGVGGSSLGARALVALASVDPLSPAPIFLEASDPLTFETVLGGISIEKTGFLVISKSGSTLETVMQTLLVMENAPVQNFIFITQPGDNPLRMLAGSYGIPVYDHDPNLVGRFSALSLVGLIPAAYAGIDIEGLRCGARGTLEQFLIAKHPLDCAPAVGAAVSVAFARKGVTVDVIMPYADRLRAFALWYRQLWAESLGKDGFGMTPVVAQGPADQHSQLQLYLDGPRDKLFNLISVDSLEADSKITGDLSISAGMPWLSGKSIANLNQALAKSTTETLIDHGRPVRSILLPTLNANVMGQLMMHFMLETIAAADMLGINAFDQPAVEFIKASSFTKMGA